MARRAQRNIPAPSPEEQLRSRFACGDRSVLRTFILKLYADEVLIKTLAASTESEADAIEERWLAGDGCTAARTTIYQER